MSHQGRCNCGAIRFEVDGPLVEASACHCTQCRKQSGHVMAGADCHEGALHVQGTPRWYEASPMARRGFCPDCGCQLFWQAHGDSTISVNLGALDAPTGLRLEKHIYVADKGDYYTIADGLPQE
ncbi:MAG: GFA family protein [Vannielia sp.]|uniref:GFA family protein n=1 Tax=Vannielia sp. TaxID=2813045 RepID=UPI003B8C91D4